jgi:signal peptide peptidase-like protein 3
MSNEMASSPINVNSNDLQTRSWLQTIIDSSHLITFCISISVIIYGSFRSLTIDKENDTYTRHQQVAKEKRSKTKLLLLEATSGQENSELVVVDNECVENVDEDDLDESDVGVNGQGDLLEHQSTQNIDSTQALFIPVAASISLLLMFFFFDSIQTAFVICTSGIKNKNWKFFVFNYS